MKTPKEFSENLKNGLITESMLQDALYSVNKRAKNWRDQKRKYAKANYYSSDIYYKKAEEEEKKMYEKKEIFLKLLKPTCIHREFQDYERTRIYDYEKRYNKEYLPALFNGEIAWENCYMNWDTYEEVWFFDKVDKTKPKYRYYLYYEFGSHTYHTPITEEEAKKSTYPIVDIEPLETNGEDIDDLLSMQFVNKMVEAIGNGANYFGRKSIKSEIEYHSMDIEGYDEYRKLCYIDAVWDSISPSISILSIKLSSENRIPYILSLSDIEDVKQKTFKDWNKQLNQLNRANKKRRRKGKPEKEFVAGKVEFKHSIKPYDTEFSEELYDLIMEKANGRPVTEMICAEVFKDVFADEIQHALLIQEKASMKENYFKEHKKELEEEFKNAHPELRES